MGYMDRKLGKTRVYEGYKVMLGGFVVERGIGGDAAKMRVSED